MRYSRTAGTSLPESWHSPVQRYDEQCTRHVILEHSEDLGGIARSLPQCNLLFVFLPIPVTIHRRLFLDRHARPMVRLRIRRKRPPAHVLAVFPRRLRNDLAHVCILSREFRRLPKRQPQQIVQHQDLSVAIFSSRVTCPASSRGTASSTTANAPAASTARASRSNCSAASAVFPCTR